MTNDKKMTPAAIIAMLRRYVIIAINNQFKEGLELTDIGATLPPDTMIGLIANGKGQVTQ